MIHDYEYLLKYHLIDENFHLTTLGFVFCISIFFGILLNLLKALAFIKFKKEGKLNGKSI